jgi:hypothetical protein
MASERVKLLFDENISQRLVEFINRESGLAAMAHINQRGWSGLPDRAWIAKATEGDFVIITGDRNEQTRGYTVEALKAIGARVILSEDGWHAVESLILARYYMFTQVYYHKTRRAYDFHIAQALKSALAGQELPSPEAISEFLQYDDWWFLGALKREEAGEHGKRIKDRAHYRLLYETPEIPSDEQVNRFNEVCDHLQQVFGDKLHRDSAEKSWYNIGRQELWVKRFFDAPIPLREYSRPIRGMESLGQLRVYVAPEVRDHAQKVMESVGGVLW